MVHLLPLISLQFTFTCFPLLSLTFRQVESDARLAISYRGLTDDISLIATFSHFHLLQLFLQILLFAFTRWQVIQGWWTTLAISWIAITHRWWLCDKALACVLSPTRTRQRYSNPCFSDEYPKKKKLQTRYNQFLWNAYT